LKVETGVLHMHDARRERMHRPIIMGTCHETASMMNTGEERKKRKTTPKISNLTVQVFRE